MKPQASRRKSVKVSHQADIPVELKNVPKTLTWLEIPAWQRDNEYIVSGYRR
jgi:hypothetical protein